MDGRILSGKVGSLPVRMGYANINQGDVSGIIGTAVGLAKTVFKAGAIGLGVGLLGLLVCRSIFSGGSNTGCKDYEEEQREKRQKRQQRQQKTEKMKVEAFRRILKESCTLNILSSVKTNYQVFHGICDTDAIDFMCEGHKISIPTNLVKIIVQHNNISDIAPPLQHNFNKPRSSVTLFDGSTFILDEDIVLDFWTFGGKHSVPVGANFVFAHGVSFREKKELEESIKSFLKEKEKDFVDCVGEGFTRIMETMSIRRDIAYKKEESVKRGDVMEVGGSPHQDFKNIILNLRIIETFNPHDIEIRRIFNLFITKLGFNKNRTFSDKEKDDLDIIYFEILKRIDKVISKAEEQKNKIKMLLGKFRGWYITHNATIGGNSVS